MGQTSKKTGAVDKGRMLWGKVVSSKMKDTVVVAVSRYFKHPKYGKYLTRTKRFKAHDPGNTCKNGDVVYITQTRPISKDKRFEVVGKKTTSVVDSSIPLTSESL